ADGGYPPETPEMRVVVLGHIQRGGTPLAEDRLIATACGSFAVDLVAQRRFGTMSAWRNQGPAAVDLAEALDPHFVNPETTPLRGIARAIGVTIGDEPEDEAGVASEETSS